MKSFINFSVYMDFYTFSLILSLKALLELCSSHLYVFDIYIKFSCKIIYSNIISTLLISFQQCLIYYLGYLLSIILTNLFLTLKISILIDQPMVGQKLALNTFSQ